MLTNRFFQTIESCLTQCIAPFRYLRIGCLMSCKHENKNTVGCARVDQDLSIERDLMYRIRLTRCWHMLPMVLL